MARAVAAVPDRDAGWLFRIASRARVEAPSRIEWIGTVLTALLLVLSFPNFNLSVLAWIGLVPLLIAIVRRPRPLTALVMGWFMGTLFFYFTCYWLTYSMIHYGGLPSWLAYVLLIPGAVVVGFFPGLAISITALGIRHWKIKAVFLAPVFWVVCEWARLGVTGQLWNALGYSQSETLHGLLILPARFAGVYAVSFFLILINCALTYVVLRPTLRSVLTALAMVAVVAFAVFLSGQAVHTNSAPVVYLHVVAVQPNVPMTPVKSTEESQQLLERHLRLSAEGLQQLPDDLVPRLVIWPESPMNFTYGTDKNLQQVISKFTRANHTSLMLNSLEGAPGGRAYNSALLINEDGRLIAQYDKIRLMPFGEYVPLPQWLGGSLISGIVGDFTPGTKFTLMPVAHKRHAGTFICIESAYPWIARRLTDEGADLLINISNDGYLGPTAVMHQHLANVILRAVENGRPLLRVTNSGLSAKIRPDGSVEDLTRGFEPAVRVWEISDERTRTFYSKYGDVFVAVCAILTGLALATLVFSRKRISNLR